MTSACPPIEKRQCELLGGALVSWAEVDTAAATREHSEAALVGFQAMVQQARADRQQTALNLEYTRIVSPVDGIVISRNRDVAQTVASAFQAPTLFLIANDLTKIRGCSPTSTRPRSACSSSLLTVHDAVHDNFNICASSRKARSARVI
jgi:hypothetical protein